MEDSSALEIRLYLDCFDVPIFTKTYVNGSQCWILVVSHRRHGVRRCRYHEIRRPTHERGEPPRVRVRPLLERRQIFRVTQRSAGVDPAHYGVDLLIAP